MPLKTLATGLVAAAAIGGIAAGIAGIAPNSVAADLPMRPVVFGAPLPQAPGADVPTADQLVGLLNGIADPNVSAANKSGLVEGGLSGIEQSVLDDEMREGLSDGYFPLTITADNVAPAGPDAATADVTASSPKLPAQTVNLRFVNQDGWKLSHSSLMTLSQLASD